MTSTSKQPPTDERRGADPWWGFDDAIAAASFDEPVAVQRASPGDGTSRRRRQRSGGPHIGWLLVGVLVAPIDLVRRMLAASPRLRRIAVRMAVIVGVLTILTCSVGVILINNVVIGRSAELGELDDRRRELRRENALLGAQAARLSSPDVVFRRATRELGMVPTDDVPQFIYLVPGSRTLTPLQRNRVAARVQQQQRRQQQQRQQRAAASEATAASMDMAASNTVTGTTPPAATPTKGAAR